MQIKNLTLKNFRNYKFLNIEFDKGINFIIGDNGVGKTNILEGITIVSNIKSFRSVNDLEIIKWGEDSYYCSVNASNGNNRRFEVGCAIISDKLKKKIKIDGNDIKRSNDYFGKLHTVIFTPLDINIINGTPELRRRFFDSVLSKLNIDYFNLLNEFKKILNSRNRLLKDINKRESDKKNLEIWDEMFSAKASEIIKIRKNFLLIFSNIFNESYSNISKNDFPTDILYASSIENQEPDSIKDHLIKNRNRDILTGATSIGPQRDDFVFYQNNKLLSNIASQGQKRTAAISLKISEMKMIENETGGRCVVLIDDIFSELDQHRRRNMIDILNGGNQVIFTMVNSEIIKTGNFSNYRSYLIEHEGKISNTSTISM